MTFSPHDVLQEALSIQYDAAAKGFDWPDIQGVFAKVREEMAEVESAWQAGELENAQHELGDLLFAVVNLARFLQVDSGVALAHANAKFSRRFSLLEEVLFEAHKTIDMCTLDELDQAWEMVKKKMASCRFPT